MHPGLRMLLDLHLGLGNSSRSLRSWVSLAVCHSSQTDAFLGKDFKMILSCSYCLELAVPEKIWGCAVWLKTCQEGSILLSCLKLLRRKGDRKDRKGGWHFKSSLHTTPYTWYTPGKLSSVYVYLGENPQMITIKPDLPSPFLPLLPLTESLLKADSSFNLFIHLHMDGLLFFKFGAVT